MHSVSYKSDSFIEFLYIPIFVKNYNFYTLQKSPGWSSANLVSFHKFLEDFSVICEIADNRLFNTVLTGADPGIYFGGAKPRSLIESWGRSPNRGREAPEYRGRSPSRGRKAPENWGRSPNRGRSPRKSGGRGLGRGLGEPLPRKFLKNKTRNHSFWCIFEAIIWND